MQIGDSIPEFNLPCAGNPSGAAQLKSRDLIGAPFILYFYPKDDTSTCTKQACKFRDDWENYRNISVPIIGVSRDSIAAHEKFRKKYQLPFMLLSDEDGKLCEEFGVWVEKSMYGHKYMGIERASFMYNNYGKLVHIWRKVKIAGHSEALLTALSTLI